MDRRPTEYQEVEYMVSATDFERRELYRVWRKRIDSWDSKPLNAENCAQTIGELDGRPIVVALFWVRLNGHLVGFYNPVSPVVDHDQVDAWIDGNCIQPRTPRRVTNAMNFENCFNDLGIALKT